MKIMPLGLLNQGKIIEYSGNFVFDIIESVKAFRNENLGSSLVMDDEGAKYLMLINEGFLRGFTNVVVNPSRHYADVLEAGSLEQALLVCPKDKDIYVLAGEKIYGDALDYNFKTSR